MALRNDKITVEAIHENMLQVKTFDYDSVRYLAEESDQVIQRIADELHTLENKIDQNNQLVYQYFFHLANDQGSADLFNRLYYDFAAFQNTFDTHKNFYNELIENTRFIFEITPFADIEMKLRDLSILENNLKIELKKLLDNPEISKNIHENSLNSLNEYISKELKYFNFDQYRDDNLELLFNALTYYNQLLEDNHFFKKSEFLKAMITLQENHLKPNIVS